MNQRWKILTLTRKIVPEGYNQHRIFCLTMNFCIFLQVIGNQHTRILADPQSTEFQPPYAEEHHILTQASTTTPQNSYYRFNLLCFEGKRIMRCGLSMISFVAPKRNASNVIKAAPGFQSLPSESERHGPQVKARETLFTCPGPTLGCGL